jgi:hypothetical protein
VVALRHNELYGGGGLLVLQQAHGQLLQRSEILVVFQKAVAVVLVVELDVLYGVGILVKEMGGSIGQNQRRNWNGTSRVDRSVQACLRRKHLKWAGGDCSFALQARGEYEKYLRG